MAKYKIGKEQKSLNTFEEYISEFETGGIIPDDSTDYSDIDDSTIAEWFSNPDDNYKEIINYMVYMYISNGNVYTLYNLFKSLSKLNYRIKSFDEANPDFRKNIVNCEKLLSQVRYKTLVRDLISQLCATGTVITSWLGNKKNPYCYVFENNEYVFAPYRLNGEWVVKIDLSWFSDMQDTERERFFETFKDLKVKAAYDKYQSGSDTTLQYFELPQERTHVLKLNTIFRNQNIGLPLALQALPSISHRNSIKKLEEDVINKIIKNIGVLTIGNKEQPYEKLNPAMRKKIIGGVKRAVKDSVSSNGVPIAVLPNYSELKFPEIKGLDLFTDGGNKYNEIEERINADIGVNATLAGGNGSNYQSAKLNLDIIHSRISVILEEIQPIFQKLFNIVLGKKIAENYYFEFITGTPLSIKEEVDILLKLHAEGMSYKAIVDLLPLTSYSELVGDTIKESKDKTFKDSLTPPKTSSTLSADDNGTKTIEDPTNEETIKSQESGGNKIDGGTK